MDLTKLYLISLSTIFLMACNNLKNKETSTNPAQVSASVQNSNSDSHSIIKESQTTDSFQITNKSIFKIISAIKSVENIPDKKQFGACDRWTLNSEEIIDIFRSSRKISGTEWDLSYEVLPCSYKGEMIIDGKPIRYEVNAASFIILIFKDTSIFLGCTEQSKRRYFLSAPF